MIVLEVYVVAEQNQRVRALLLNACPGRLTRDALQFAA
jgi:hypothetical protein